MGKMLSKICSKKFQSFFETRQMKIARVFFDKFQTFIEKCQIGLLTTLHSPAKVHVFLENLSSVCEKHQFFFEKQQIFVEDVRFSFKKRQIYLWKTSDLPLKNVRFSLKTSDFPWKTSDFLNVKNEKKNKRKKNNREKPSKKRQTQDFRFLSMRKKVRPSAGLAFDFCARRIMIHGRW